MSRSDRHSSKTLCCALTNGGKHFANACSRSVRRELRKRPPTVIFYYSVNCLGHCTDGKNEVKNDCNDVRLKTIIAVI